MSRQSAARRGYGTPWQRARASFLGAHPWCRMCADEGRQVRAVHVHHATAHKGDRALFWDKSRWVPLCEAHHNRDAQQIEARGYRSAVDGDGLPVDPNHPFNAVARPDRPQCAQSASQAVGGDQKSSGARPKDRAFNSPQN